MSAKKLASNIEWQYWGRIDPLFGAASWAGKAKAEGAPWTDDEFYKLGESDWQDFASHWERYGLDRESCIEIGCGPGRITMQLGKYFGTVDAIDVAQASIDYARKRVRAPSVRFHLGNGVQLPIGDEAMTAVFSCHVFQHFDSWQVARRQFMEIHRVLRSSGSFMIHLPIHTWPVSPRFFNSVYTTRHALSDVLAHLKRTLVASGRPVRLMRGISYELRWLYSELALTGFGDIEVMMFATKSNGDLHPFVFGRKPANKAFELAQ